MANEGNTWKYSPDLDNQSVPSNDEKQESAASSGSGRNDSFSWISSTGSTEKRAPIRYVVLALLTIFLASIVFIFTRDKMSTSVILISGLILGFYGARKPGKIEYKISDVGFTIGSKQYEFNKFKSFSILANGNHLTVALTPLKRFMPYMYINFSMEQQAKITPVLSKKLPIEDKKSDIIERFTRYIGF